MSSKRDALRQLRELRAGGVKRSEQYEVRDSGAIVEEVDEEEYRKLCKARRNDNFVVDDQGGDGGGYIDDGQELWDDQEEYDSELEKLDDEEEAGGSKNARKMLERARRQRKAEREAAARRMQDREKGQRGIAQFFKGGTRSKPAASRAKEEESAPVDTAAVDDMLDGFEDELMAMDEAGPVETVPRKVTTSVAASIASRKRPVEDCEVADTTGVKIEEDKLPVGEAQEATSTVELQNEAIKRRRTSMDDDSDEVAKEASHPVEAKLETSPSGHEAKKGSTAAAKGAPSEPTVKFNDSPQKVVDFGDSWLITDEVEDAAAEATSSPRGASAEDRGLDAVKEEDGSLMMYLLDVYEGTLPDKSPALFLFGKTRRKESKPAKQQQQFESCCMVVSNIMRNCFFLPRQQFEDEGECRKECFSIMQEFEALRKKSGGALAAVNKYKCKVVWRNYCFDQVHGIPHGRLGFLKLVYSSSLPPLPAGLEGESFSHVFGTNTSLTELFLVKRRIMGPCWIQVDAGAYEPSTALGKLSWCAREVRVTSGTKQISVVSADAMPLPPPLSIMSLSIKTNTVKPTKSSAAKGKGSAAQQQHEIAVAAYYHNPSLDIDEASEECLRRGMQTFMAVTKIEGVPFPKGPLAKNVVVESSERALLNHLAAMVTRADPDIILGHNIFGFGLDILAQRMQHHKLPAWHKFSRLKRQSGVLPFGQSGKKRDCNSHTGGGSMWLGRSLTAGRLVCDTYLSAREYVKMTTYDLGSLSMSLLKTPRAPVSLDSLVKFYEDPRALSALAEHTLTDAVLQLRVGWALQVLSLTRQLTNLAGNLWSHSLQNKRAERNEILLVHEFHRKKFIVPDKERPGDRRGQAKGDVFDEDGGDAHSKPAAGPRRKKAAYAGGLVLEPKAGLYDKLVLLLDFNSLYPSIIREYNICFTTVDRLDAHDSALEGNEGVIPELPSRAPGERDAILPQVITRLVESRKDVKKLLRTCNNSKSANQLDIRQKALKLTANSMYGCLGFSNSRFYAKPIAALITRTGRETLQATVDIVENHLRFDVVYGDTDSIFVHTGTEAFDQAMRVGGQIMAEVNKRYKKLELDIDGVFKRLLLLKKKKYAGVKVIDWAKGIAEKEYKGLDLVRRDWCPLSKKMGDEVLRCLLGLSAESQAPASSEIGPADVDRSAQEAERVVEWLHDYVKSVSLKMDNGEIPLEDYVITKALTKMPADYPDAKSQAHVMVAKRMMDEGHVIRPGNEIPYVITLPVDPDAKEDDGADSKPAAVVGTDSQSVAARARSIDEVRKMGPSRLPIDTQWEYIFGKVDTITLSLFIINIIVNKYKTHQIHPPLVRICAPVSGTDAAHLAECLGLDPSKFAAIGINNNGADDGDDIEAVMASLSQKIDIDTKYSDARKFLAGSDRQFKCHKCKTACHIADAIKQKECIKCSAEISSALLRNLLTMVLRKVTREAGAGWVRCDDEGCGRATRQLPLGTSRCPFGGCRGRLQQLPGHTNRALHQILSYLRELTAKHRPECEDIPSQYLSMNAYDVVNKTILFSMFVRGG